MQNIKEILLFGDMILLSIVFILSIHCARKFDSDLKNRYPDTVEQIKRNFYSFSVKGIAPLFSISFIETSIVRDEKLRQLRRKAIFSFILLSLVMASFLVFILI
jgi:hypothetical protein